MRRFLLASAVMSALCSPARTEFLEISYEQVASNMTALLERVSLARELSSEQSRVAKQISGAWVAAGPCKMPHIQAASDAFPILLNPAPEIGYHAAVLEMVAILSADNLGRGPTEHVCRFSANLANS